MSRRAPITDTEPCPEFIDIGPFRFECGGHLAGAKCRALDYHGGKLTHHASSRQDVGDVDVTFWTMVDDPDEGDHLGRAGEGR